VLEGMGVSGGAAGDDRYLTSQGAGSRAGGETAKGEKVHLTNNSTVEYCALRERERGKVRE
jgi:hypothetical protein